ALALLVGRSLMLALRNCVDRPHRMRLARTAPPRACINASTIVHNSALICTQESTNWPQDEAAATDDAPGRGSMLVFPGTSGFQAHLVSRHIWAAASSDHKRIQATAQEEMTPM